MTFSEPVHVDYSQSVGIFVGNVTGRIGSAVLDRLRGFSCRTLAYDTRPTAAAHYVPLGELLGQSDIVTLHTPLTADTHHLLDRRRIGQMKHGAFIEGLADMSEIRPARAADRAPQTPGARGHGRGRERPRTGPVGAVMLTVRPASGP